MIAHNAFDDGALSGTILAEKGVKRSRNDFERDFLVGNDRPESLCEVDNFEGRRFVAGVG
jgi:hypothetical protein